MMLCDKEHIRMFTDKFGHGNRCGGMDGERDQIAHMEYPWVRLVNDILQSIFETLDLCIEESLCIGCRNFSSFQGLDCRGTVIEFWYDDTCPIGECIGADFYNFPSQTRK